jgi:hypothetical protein
LAAIDRSIEEGAPISGPGGRDAVQAIRDDLIRQRNAQVLLTATCDLD